MGRLDHNFTDFQRLSFRITRNMNLDSGGNFYDGFLNMGANRTATTAIISRPSCRRRTC